LDLLVVAEWKKTYTLSVPLGEMALLGRGVGLIGPCAGSHHKPDGAPYQAAAEHASAQEGGSDGGSGRPDPRPTVQ
jgi:hypothetical protein